MLGSSQDGGPPQAGESVSSGCVTPSCGDLAVQEALDRGLSAGAREGETGGEALEEDGAVGEGKPVEEGDGMHLFWSMVGLRVSPLPCRTRPASLLSHPSALEEKPLRVGGGWKCFFFSCALCLCQITRPPSSGAPRWRASGALSPILACCHDTKDLLTPHHTSAPLWQRQLTLNDPKWPQNPCSYHSLSPCRPSSLLPCSGSLPVFP